MYNELLAESLYRLHHDNLMSFADIRKTYGVSRHVARALLAEYERLHNLVPPKPERKPIGRPRKLSREHVEKKQPRRRGPAPKSEERAVDMYTRWAQGERLDDIGIYYGISRERVRQIVMKYAQRHHLTPAVQAARAIRRQKKEAQKQERAEQKRRAYHKRAMRNEVGDIELDLHLIHKLADELGDHRLFYAWHRGYHRRKDGTRYTEDRGAPSAIEFRDRAGRLHKLHRWVVAQHGITFEHDSHVILHKDEDITNNRFDNLEILSRSDYGKRIAVMNNLGEKVKAIAYSHRKLTMDQARYVRQTYMVEKTPAELSRELGVSQSILLSIVRNLTYKEDGRS